ncbi:ATP-binding protein [Nodularia harveyana UHCC-0300]|uniref:ATP-binding protein n=1 Tax=Nodularia harveyana UHCC-0300 TaxID=2974287 RepID=A0ABU5UE53_9CYAN|nr:ATP-binding protein [Nodularia harveyana]MEA5581653.1 ATP-binding protein [Nodularia harveyana UHCC-0300]
MNSLSFSASAKNENFVGRDFVFSAINNFLHRYPKGYLTIVGVPGSGKSAILAQLLRQNPDIIYYNAQVPGKNRLEEFLTDICTQLSLWLDNFYSTTPQGRREIEVVNANEGSWLFSNLLQQVSEKLSPENKLIIIIDSLDRVDINSQAVGTNLFYLPRYLPNQVYFIFARRPYQRSHSGLLIEAPSQVLDLADYPEENREDVREFLRRNLTPLTPLPYEGMGEQDLPNSPFLPGEGLGERSNLIGENEENFRYVQQVLTAFNYGFYDDHDVNAVPPGLEVYYQELWGKMQGDGLSDVAVNVLGVLTSGEMQPLSMLDISKVINEDVFDVMEVLEGWLEFLQVISTGKEVKYQLYHYGFREWLRGCLSC